MGSHSASALRDVGIEGESGRGCPGSAGGERGQGRVSLEASPSPTRPHPLTWPEKSFLLILSQQRSARATAVCLTPEVGKLPLPALEPGCLGPPSGLVLHSAETGQAPPSWAFCLKWGASLGKVGDDCSVSWTSVTPLLWWSGHPVELQNLDSPVSCSLWLCDLGQEG